MKLGKPETSALLPGVIMVGGASALAGLQRFDPTARCTYCGGAWAATAWYGCCMTIVVG